MQVRSRYQVNIPPESSKLVEVCVDFDNPTSTLFIERSFISNGNPEELYGTTDTLINRSDSQLFVSNFSKNTITILTGQVLGLARNPSSWLDKEGKFSESQRQDVEKSVCLVQTLIRGQSAASEMPVPIRSSTRASKCQIQEILDPSRSRYSEEDPLAELPVEGGPKTAEMPEEVIPEVKLLQELDVSTNLSQDKIQRIQSILMRHKGVFGLDSRLGNYAEEVRIPLIPDTKPILVPPFHASPANHEVIDKQMDSWLNLGVIEPS